MIQSERNKTDLLAADTVILCCNTLEDELGLLLRELGLDHQVVWVEAGMHNQPDKLRDHLNGALREIKARRVLMAMGQCGGACAGLLAGDYELVIPRADDCLSVLMGSMEKRKAAGRTTPTYFLTAGWLRHTESLINAFARDSERLGPEKARRAYRIMLKHYRRFGFIDTGAYDLNLEKEKIAPLAEILGMDLERLEGDPGWLKRLLTGPWPPSEFITIAPHSRLEPSAWSRA